MSRGEFEPSNNPSLLRPKCAISIRVSSRAGSNAAVLLGLISLASIRVAAVFLTEPFASRAGADFKTFRRLTTSVLAHNYAERSDRFNASHPRDIWTRYAPPSLSNSR